MMPDCRRDAPRLIGSEAEIVPEYLTTAEVGRRLKWSARTIRTKVAEGFFVEGREFVAPAGCRPRWIWEAVVRRMEGRHERSSAEPVLSLARAGGRGLL
jgi:hypothetical protein